MYGLECVPEEYKLYEICKIVVNIHEPNELNLFVSILMPS